MRNVLGSAFEGLGQRRLPAHVGFHLAWPDRLTGEGYLLSWGLRDSGEIHYAAFFPLIWSDTCGQRSMLSSSQAPPATAKTNHC